MKITDAVAALLVSAVATTALAACDSSAPKVAVDNVQTAAGNADRNAYGPCPLGFDVNAALKKAGIAATATPSKDEPPVTGAAMPNQGGAGLISCIYALSGGGSLVVRAAAVHTGKAIRLIAEVLQVDGDTSGDALDTFVAQDFKPGKAQLTPGAGLAAVVGVGASGGEILLDATTETPNGVDDTKRPIAGEPLRKLAEELGKQVKV